MVRTLRFLRLWIENHPTDFDEDPFLEQNTIQFLQNVSTFKIAANEIIKSLNEKPRLKNAMDIVAIQISEKESDSCTDREDKDVKEESGGERETTVKGREKEKKEKNICSFRARAIAKQWTLIDLGLYKKIAAKECVKKAWNKEGKEISSPNIVTMIDSFNKVCIFMQNTAPFMWHTNFYFLQDVQMGDSVGSVRSR